MDADDPREEEADEPGATDLEEEQEEEEEGPIDWTPFDALERIHATRHPGIIKNGHALSYAASNGQINCEAACSVYVPQKRITQHGFLSRTSLEL